jgi:cell division protease FtsH
MENRPPPPQETPRRPPTGARKTDGAGGTPTPPWLWLILIVLFAAIFWLFVPKQEIQVQYSPWFTEQVRKDNIKTISFQGIEIRGELREPQPYQNPSGGSNSVRRFVAYAPSEDMIKSIAEELEKHNAVKVKEGKPNEQARIEGIPPNVNTNLAWLMLLLPTFVILGFIYIMMRRARDQFDVEFLKSPEKFQRLGGRIPKGVLLIGPPGSGKTLLARAVAGEAGVPFYSISGSEFIQMFVGVGASRVRDMFKTAKENSPCILFIDEIDAVGRIRGAGLGGGHDEREQTLNQILTEMDGFAPNESVIVLAATNRPDVLDPALLRPGRFDRHVTVDRPTKKGRLEILKVHSRNVPLATDVDLDRIARSTVGMSGADLANLVNEAALLATRENKSAVDSVDLDAALDKVILGAKREDVITEKDKRVCAYHETGHALVAWLTAKSDPVHKVTIIPRGRALGVTQYLPEEDRFNSNESQILAMLDYTLGGRAAERLVYGELSTGAAEDLKQATRLARLMVTQWGMSERLGPVFFRASEEHPFLGREMAEPRDHSEHTAQLIDEEVARILREADDRAFHVLEEHRDDLERVTEALIEREVLTKAEIEELVGKRVVDEEEIAEGRHRKDEIVASIDNPS